MKGPKGAMSITFSKTSKITMFIFHSVSARESVKPKGVQDNEG